MFKKIFYLVSGLVILYLLVGFFFSDAIIHFDRRSLEEDRIHVKLNSVHDLGLPPPEEVVIESKATKEKSLLKGWFFLNPKSEQSRCAVILQHGYQSTRWAVLKYSPLFWERGCSILSMDARYHGESEGSCGTFGYHESKDMQDILQWFVKKTNLPKSRIGIMGESMGGTISFLVASREPELAFVALDSVPSDFYDSIAYEAGRQYGNSVASLMLPIAMKISEFRCDFRSEEVSPKRFAKQIKIPVFLSHSKSDTNVPSLNSQIVFDNIEYSKKLLFLNDWGSSHVRDINTNYREYEKHMNKFLKEYIPNFGIL